MSSEPTPPLSTPPAARRTPTLGNLFVGPNGIRAGWRLLIFYAIVFALFAVLFGIVHILHIGGTKPQTTISQLSPALVLLSEGPILLLTVIAALIMARIEHRRFSEYGFGSGGMLGRNFGSGCLWGVYCNQRNPARDLRNARLSRQGIRRTWDYHRLVNGGMELSFYRLRSG